VTSPLHLWQAPTLSPRAPRSGCSPFAPGGFDETPLAEFTRDKELLAFREHFFVLNEVPHLTCVLTYQDPVVDAGTLAQAREIASGVANGQRATGVRRRSEPPADLDERDRALWVTMREWRWQTSREEGVPPFVVLTDREMTEVVVRKPDSPTALGHVPGIGPAKVRRYAKAILGILNGPKPQDAAKENAAEAGPAVRAADTPAAKEMEAAAWTA
jgi:ATP-dependent DNA helicase RecQ